MSTTQRELLHLIARRGQFVYEPDVDDSTTGAALNKLVADGWLIKTVIGHSQFKLHSEPGALAIKYTPYHTS